MSSRNPASILYDAEGNAVVVIQDNLLKLAVGDEETRSLLDDILTELKQMNFHLRHVTDLHPREDVE